MYIARILYPVKVLGPGLRIGIWFDGCKHKCKGCSNPELWEFQERYRTSSNVVINLIEKITENNIVDGFTLTGGDPLEQPEALRVLLPKLKKINADILMYTGYEYKTVADKYSDIFENITVLIDGKYIEERNNNCILRGSDNQNIYILNDNYKEKYEHYLNTAKNEIQDFTSNDGIISVGIHRPDYNRTLKNLIKEKGLEGTE